MAPFVELMQSGGREMADRMPDNADSNGNGNGNH